MATVMSVTVVLLLVFVATMNPAMASDCNSVLASISTCKNFLKNPSPIVPETQCCDAVTNLIGLQNVDLCQCLRQNPLSSTFLPSKAQQLPDLCGQSSSAAFAPLSNCLVSSKVDHQPDSNLPPLFPFPPISFPFPPINFPLPPLIPGPLPPLIPGPLPPIFPLPPQIPLPPLPGAPPAA